MENYVYPRPQSAAYGGGTLKLPERPVVLFDNTESPELFEILSVFHKNVKKFAGIDCYIVPNYAGKLKVSVTFTRDPAFEGEKYELLISSDGIFVKYGTPVGAFRAQATLTQLLAINRRAQKCVYITDWPDLTRRGFMLDISRGKVPKLEKIFALIDLLALLKMNELQLYLENFSVEYAAYPEYAHILDAYTPFEVLQLTNYAKERYINLVPNQNSFGHMALWIARPELAHLSINPEGGGATLNPLDPGSLELVANLYDSLLPSFSTDRINIGCDEVRGLKNGKVAERVAEVGEINVYLEQLLKINDLVRARGLRAQFWGDILLRHADAPDIIRRVPKDMIPMVWSYDGYSSFAEHANLVSSLGYDYYICPGTSSWNSMFPDLTNSCLNVLDAAKCAVKYHALGVLMTEWGDFGHIQFDFAMQLGLVYAAGTTWALKRNENFDLACDFADAFIFHTEEGCRASELIRRGAQFHDGEIFWSLYHDLKDNTHLTRREHEFEYTRYFTIKQGMQELARDAQALAPTGNDATLLKAEIISSAQFYELLADYMLFRFEYAETGKMEDFSRRYADFCGRYQRIRTWIKQCWNERNTVPDNDCMFRLVDRAFANLEKYGNEQEGK